MLENKNHDQNFVAFLSHITFQSFGRESGDEPTDQDWDETYPVKNIVPDIDRLDHLAKISSCDIGIHSFCDKNDEKVD